MLEKVTGLLEWRAEDFIASLSDDGKQFRSRSSAMQKRAAYTSVGI